MNQLALKLKLALKAVTQESGQDLVEYALVVSLIAFAGVAGMRTMANSINSTFTSIGSSLRAS